MDDDANPNPILQLFPGRTVAMLNPRGVETSDPRPVCRFDADYWQEELGFERERAITETCRQHVARQGVPMALFETTRLARDVDAMVAALGWREAGIFGVSYGTESALHLIAARPRWLRFAVLDSVSLPGLVGLGDQLHARDKFLNVINHLCFEIQHCPEDFRARHRDLKRWAQQFDARPLAFRVGPHNEPWAFDAVEMLDFVSSLSTYSDGAAYGVEFLQIVAETPKAAADFIAAEITDNTQYGIDNFPLIMDAYADGVTEDDYAALEANLAYPTEIDEFREYLDIYRVWNREERRERPFVTDATRSEPAGIPVLILSGGVDMATPLRWALRLHQRFSGMTHYVFPYLGHATAFGQDSDVSEPQTIMQIQCAPKIIAAFLASTPPDWPCDQYLYEVPQ